jgi:hypothetical protein
VAKIHLIPPQKISLCIEISEIDGKEMQSNKGGRVKKRRTCKFYGEVENFQPAVRSWTFSTRDSTIAQQLRVVEIRK